MGSREVCERRAWRLAALLTGDRRSAGWVVARALDAQPDLTRLPDARLDRLVILRSRELAEGAARRRRRRPGALTRLRAGHRARRGVGKAPTHEGGVGAAIFHGDAAPAAVALRTMPHQAMEAWILHELDGRDMMDVGRAMDCSKAAAANHLDTAMNHMRMALAEGLKPGVEALRQQAAALDPAPFLEQRRQARRHRARLRWIRWLVAVVTLLGAAGAAWWVVR